MNRIVFGKATLVIGGHEYPLRSVNGVAMTIEGRDVCSDRIEWPINGWSASFKINRAINLDALFGTRRRSKVRPRRIGMRRIRRLKYWRSA
ncbi:hypothetical protein SB781_03295 [Paraburkholderia sp. SIMBA_061]